jgi:hypothetical protein
VERDLRVRRTVNTLLLLLGEHRGVAAQVAFESKLLNQDITFQFQGLKPGALKLWVN